MFHVYWPATAALSLFLVVGVIIVMLRWGPVICKTRHTALPDRQNWRPMVYEQRVSFA